MSKLLIRPGEGFGRIAHVTPEIAGWAYAGFDLWRLGPGEMAEGGEATRETCLVIISGKARIAVDEKDFGILGERLSPFEGKPWSVYAPAGALWSAEAASEAVIAVCTAPSAPHAYPARVIAPDTLLEETRGKGTNIRHVTNILPESDPQAASLLVVEVITPGGHTSSYPPHKHDRDALPAESLLEETYYHRIRPPQGFAFQRVYTDKGADGRRALDEALVVEDGDVVLVPKGYHPCAALHGYDLYYLNVMAGPKRTWKFHNAPEHEWLLRGTAA